MVEGKYRPARVTASATKGIATGMGCDPRTEDTITLLVDWVKVGDESKRGTAVYTASWAAPLKAGVHSEQRFHYMAAEGEVIVEDAVGKSDINATYMKYSPDEDGFFDSQRGYGYISLEKFVDAARRVNAGTDKAADFEGKGLPTIKDTVLTTAIIQAGRISIDEQRTVEIVDDKGKWKLV
jgi:D-galacturonate reductase